jgi:hypothetical protein
MRHNKRKEIQWAPRGHGSSCLLGPVKVVTAQAEYNLYKLTTCLALLKLTVDLDFLAHHGQIRLLRELAA